MMGDWSMLWEVLFKFFAFLGAIDVLVVIIVVVMMKHDWDFDIDIHKI